MAKVHKYDMSRRLDNGKWEVVGKAYKDSESGRLTVWIEPAKMAKIVKGQKDGVPFILFDKDPEPLPVCPQTTAPAAYIDPTTKRKTSKPQQAPPVYLTVDAQRTAKFTPKSSFPPPIETKPSDSWPPEFDDDIPF